MHTKVTSVMTQCACCDDDNNKVMLTHSVKQEKRLHKQVGTYIWSLYRDVRAQSVNIRLLQPLHKIMILHIWPI